MKRRLYIIAVAPVEFVMLVVVGAWNGAMDAVDNICSAWVESK